MSDPAFRLALFVVAGLLWGAGLGLLSGIYQKHAWRIVISGYVLAIVVAALLGYPPE